MGECFFPKLQLSHVFFLSFLALRAVLAPSCGSNTSGMWNQAPLSSWWCREQQPISPTLHSALCLSRTRWGPFPSPPGHGNLPLDRAIKPSSWISSGCHWYGECRGEGSGGSRYRSLGNLKNDRDCYRQMWNKCLDKYVIPNRIFSAWSSWTQGMNSQHQQVTVRKLVFLNLNKR